ncbi:MAG: sulfate ABC transporter permease subunit CysT [Rhodospirillaceae bacterium]|nr:sulfate ABC transporter permease subunit CysT [Rhodospirillaceae bacterium]
MVEATALPAPKGTVLPGLGLTLGMTLAYLGLIVLLPLAAVFATAAGMGLDEILRLLMDPRTLAALRVSFATALLAAAINAVAGLVVAWVLVRYDFPLKRLVDGVIDLPFALPTAVAGIALAGLYGPNGWVGAPLAEAGLRVAYTPADIVVALAFIGLPFVVRTVEPVLADLDREYEEAAATLGASRLQVVSRVVMPVLLPPLLTGFALAFARGVGEYGSVIFIAGNLPYLSEVAPLLIVIKLEEYNYAGATTIAAAMLLTSFLMLLVINLLGNWTRRRAGHV